MVTAAPQPCGPDAPVSQKKGPGKSPGQSNREDAAS